MQTYMKPPSKFAPWVVPSQILRGFVLAVALYPFLGRILEMKRWGWLSVSSLDATPTSVDEYDDDGSYSY